MKKTKIRGLTIMPFLLAAALFLGGCFREIPEPAYEPSPSPSPSPTPIAAEPSPLPQNGGTLNLSMRMPKTLNPLLNEDSSVDGILKLLFLPLSVLDETGKPVPNAAFVESIVFAEDGLSAVVRLKSSGQWQDGTPVTGEDVAFSVNTLRAGAATALYKPNVENMLSPEVLEERAVRLNFAKSSSAMRYALCFPVVPAHYYENETDPASEANMRPMGNGSYAFAEYHPVESLRLVASGRAPAVRPYINAVTVWITADRETDFYAFDRGMIDAVYGDIAASGQYLGTNNYRVAVSASTDYDFIGFNFDRLLFNEKAVREAVAHATPYDRIVSEVYVRYALRTKSPVNPDSWLYEPLTKDRAYSLTAAKETLTAAGWVQNAGTGVFEKPTVVDDRNEPARLACAILVNEENEERMKIAEMLSWSLNSIGFSATIQAVDFETYTTRLAERDFDLFVGGYHLSLHPDLSFLLHSGNAGYGTNCLNYRDPETDALLTAAATSPTEEGYKTAMSALQKRIAEELPVISLVFRESALILNKKIHGEVLPALDNRYGKINQWYIG